MPKTLSSLFLVSCFLFLVASPSPAHAQTRPWIYSDCNSDPDSLVQYKGVATFKGTECVVGNILNVAITLIGTTVLIMFVLGSYQLMTSGGDPKAVAAAKTTLTHAVLGLILAIGSWFIINLIASFTGAKEIKIFSTQV